MKKIFMLFLMSFLLILVGCKNDADLNENTYSFNLSIESVTPLRESIVLNVKLSDEEKLLTKSNVTYTLVEKETDKQVKSSTVTFTDNASEIKIISLTAGTEYVVTFTTGYKGKNILLAEKEITTSTLGTEKKPYEITTAEELKNFVTNDRSAYFKLANDIDFAGTYLDPLCKSSSTFTGHFDGNGKSLKNFKTGAPDDPETTGNEATYLNVSYGGLFGYVASSATIKNLTFDGAEVYLYRSSTVNYGLLAGFNAGTIEGVTVKNSKISYIAKGTSTYYIGGIVGYNADFGKVTNCVVENTTLEVTGTNGDYIVGGVVARNEAPTEKPVRNIIDGCKFIGGNITVTTDGSQTVSTLEEQVRIEVGGIIARNFSLVQNCESSAAITVNADNQITSNIELEVGKELEGDVPFINVLVGGLVADNNKSTSVLKKSKSAATFAVSTEKTTITLNVTKKVEEGDPVKETSVYAATVYVGGLAGKNGITAETNAVISNCEYNFEGENTVKVFDSSIENNIGFGVVGKDFVNVSGNVNKAHTYKVEHYVYETQDAGTENEKEVLVLGTTDTITIAEVKAN